MTTESSDKITLDNDVAKNHDCLDLDFKSKYDWFDDMPKEDDVKNRHLINISRPTGVNCVSRSCNGNRDIRGIVPNQEIMLDHGIQNLLNQM